LYSENSTEVSSSKNNLSSSLPSDSMSLQVVKTEELIDSVNLDLYEHPYVLGDCGHTFSEVVVRALDPPRCPTCRKDITVEPKPNYALRDVISSRETIITEVYELFLVDVSTSMNSSDYFGPFKYLMGEARLDVAKSFCHGIAAHRELDNTQKMGLISFGSNVTDVCLGVTGLRFINELKQLKPVEAQTCIFDAFDHAIDHFKSMNNQYKLRLFLLTDGGENSSDPRNTEKWGPRLSEVLQEAERLKVTTFLVNVSGDESNSRKLAHTFRAKFKDIRPSNWKKVVHSICHLQFRNREDEIQSLLQQTPPVPNALLAPRATSSVVNICSSPDRTQRVSVSV